MSEIVKDDGRGIISGDWLNQYHDITKEDWYHDCFPQWGLLLNNHIQNYQVPRDEVAMWWCGGPSWVLKTDEGGIFFIDQYSGPAMYTERHYCGVCNQSGAKSINWIRLNPQIIDPWEFKRLDGVFCTHKHQDHCDIYTINAALKTTNTKFYAPPVAAEKIKGMGVPSDRLIVSKVGGSVKLPGAEVEFLYCFDTTAIQTGGGSELPYDEVATSFLFKTSGGNILFLGDTWFHDGYVAMGRKYKIDVATFDMGWNASGATDKMTPYDCARVGQILNAKVLIPDHSDNWINTASNPDMLCKQFVDIVKQNTPHIKPVILKVGAQFNYPRDADNETFYRYPDDLYQTHPYDFPKGKYAQFDI
jgi:L-ascorbate 6-phosphate lactonase